jgi:hypothetical protein
MVSSAKPITSAVGFVDWNTQLILTPRDTQTDPVRTAEIALRQTTRRIAKCLSRLNPEMRFRVALRLYHGWHRGFEPTVNRKAAQRVIGGADFATLSQSPNVVFSQNVSFGDRLVNALDIRLHQRLAIHLPNTVRERSDKRIEEKMVDTALVADVVATAHNDEKNWIVVVTEDDDLIPSVYAAEAALAGSQAKVILLRQRGDAGLTLLDNLLVKG